MICYFIIKVCEVSTGEGLGAGARGEIWVRGPTVMKGVFSLQLVLRRVTQQLVK